MNKCRKQEDSSGTQSTLFSYPGLSYPVLS
jgi:hypothetical protein